MEENEEGQRTLVVAYAVDLVNDGQEFADLERQLIIDLSRILPRIRFQPDGLVVVAGTFNTTTAVTGVATRAATMWVEGQISDQEFEETWQRQTVDDE